MRLTLLIHVLAGALGLLSGYVALAVSKGAPAHRKAGMLFVYVMVTMATTGAVVSAASNIAPAINIPTALLAFYLVITGMTTVGAPAGWSKRFDVAAMLFGFGTALVCAGFIVYSLGQGGAGAGMAYPLALFGGVALAAAIGDRRVIRGGALRGAPRLMRHLWRMCFALFVSSIAFYLGPDRLPEALQHPAFRATGVLLPVAAIAYWKWKLRSRRPVREIVHLSAPEAV
jgi:hypothetical protein